MFLQSTEWKWVTESGDSSSYLESLSNEWALARIILIHVMLVLGHTLNQWLQVHCFTENEAQEVEH